MAQITEFNTTNLKQINSEIQAALDLIAQKHGIQLKVGKTRYDKTFYEVKVNAAIVTDGMAQTKEMSDFALYASIYGLKPEHLNAEFTSNGKTFRVTGINTKAPKFPVICQCIEDGRSYKFGAESVKRHLLAVA